MVNDNEIVQWAYLLDPCFQIVNTAGKPLTEGYIEVYYQGTRDKYYCACDFDGTLLPFQIPLDSLGSNIVLASPYNAYDIYIYNKFGSLIMSRYNVKPGHGAGGSGGLSTITITSSDGTVQIDRTGNTYDLSIQDTIDRIDELEEAIAAVSGVTEYSVATGYGDGGTFVLTDKETKDITYLNDMSGWRLQPGKVYQLNFNTKFTLDDKYNNLVEGKLYLDGDMSFSQDWAFSLDDSFDHVHHINGSTIIVVPDSLQYYDLALKYTFNSVVNCAVDLENISIVDITSIVKDTTEYTAGDGINIEEHVISVDMDFINEQINIDEKLSSAINICNDYTDNSINEVNTTISNVSGDIINYVDTASGNIINYIDNSIGEVNTTISNVSGDIIDYVDTASGNIINYVNNASGDIITYVDNASGDIINYVNTASGNIISYVDNASGDIINYVDNASGDIINYIDNSIGDVVDVIASATATLEQEIQDIPPQVQSDWEQEDNTQVDYIKNKPEEIELIAGQNIGLFEGVGTLTISASATDLSNCATHSEVYSATSSAIASANSYTDTAIANIDLTPAVEIVSPNNTISVSSVTDTVNNTKTFYIDTNDPDTNYWLGEARLSLSDQSSQGQVGYYKDVFDYTTKLNGNLDETKLKKGLYLLTANVMIVADEINNDLAEIQILSNSTSAITNANSIYQHDCSIAGDDEPGEESHQIATIVRVVYDDTPMSLIARLNTPTNISNELHLWFDDICLYELKGTSTSGGTTPSASGSYDAGWGIVINGNVISVNQSIIPDVSNFATETYVNNRIASAVNIVESEIPDVSDMATRTWVNSQGFLTTIPSYYATDIEVSNAIATAINSIPEQVNADWNSASGKSEILNKPDLSVYSTNAEVYNATVTAISVATANIPTQVQSDWTEDDTEDPSYIQNKPETIDVDVCPIIAGTGISIIASGDSAVLSCTVPSGESYSAGNGIDITNHTISIDNTVALKREIPDVSSFVTSTEVSAIVGSVSSIIENDIPDTSDMATKTWVNNQGFITAIPSEYATDSEVSAAIATATNDMATQTWVTSQGYLTSIPSYYATETEVVNAIATAVSAIPAQVQSDWDEDDSADPAYIQNKPETVDVDVCPIIAGANITITASGDSAVISSTGGGGGSTYTAGSGIDITSDVISVDNTIARVSAIPDTSDMATKTWVGQQGYLTSVPSQYITETELASELTDYALASAIPAPVSGASGVKVEASVVSLDNPVGLCAGDNITITVSGDSAIISGQAGGGSSYSAGDYISINNDNIISVTGFTDLVAGSNITITASGTSAIISGQAGGSSYTAGDGIDISAQDVISVKTDGTTIHTNASGQLEVIGGGSGGNSYVKVITDSAGTSQVTYGDLRALCEGNEEFDLFYNATYDYRRYIYRCSRAVSAGSQYEVCFTTVPISDREEQLDNVYGKYANKVYDIYFWFWKVSDGGPSDDTVAYVGSNYISGVNTHNFAERSIQANWNETDSNAQSYIRNKPDLSTFVTSTQVSAIAEAEVSSVETVSIDVCPILAGTNVTITSSGDSAVIDATIDTSTLATKAEVQTVSAAIPDTTGMITYNGNTAINHVQLVSALPASPDANTLYLIPEA